MVSVWYFLQSVQPFSACRKDESVAYFNCQLPKSAISSFRINQIVVSSFVQDFNEKFSLIFKIQFLVFKFQQPQSNLAGKSETKGISDVVNLSKIAKPRMKGMYLRLQGYTICVECKSREFYGVQVPIKKATRSRDFIKRIYGSNIG